MKSQFPQSLHRQKGLTLIEATIGIALIGATIALLLRVLDASAEDISIRAQSSMLADYVNANAGFMADQGRTEPDADAISSLNEISPGVYRATGTDWLKPDTCGGDFDEEESFLSCSVDTNFNKLRGIDTPQVTFDYNGVNSAEMEFGSIRDEANQIDDPVTAARLALGINANIEAAGYQHVSAYRGEENAEDPESAVLRARVDNNIRSDVYVRRDGTNEMTGPLLSEHDSWALIARNEDGDEVAEAQSSEASANINDLYARSNEAWLSETHELAERAYARAARSVQYMSEVAPGETVPKPNCEPGTNPQIFVGGTPFFVGTDNTGDEALISGVRRDIDDQGDEWQVSLAISADGTGGFQSVSPDEARVMVMTRCI